MSNIFKKNIFKKIDINSLQFRLTLGIAAVSTIGLGSLAFWTGWRMHHILIDSHKQNIEQLAKRIPQDVAVYAQTYSTQKALQKTLSNLDADNSFLWVKNSDNQIVAKSMNPQQSASQVSEAELLSLDRISLIPKVYTINNRYFIQCGGSLTVPGKFQGRLFVVLDISRDQIMFNQMIGSVSTVSAIFIVIIAGAIALYIKSSMKPLKKFSRMTEAISVDDLGNAQLYLENAPSEVKELAQTCNMMLSRLSDSWEKERQFVSNVSHELRTPLTIVHGYLQSILRRPQNLTELQTEALETSASEAERTIHLLQDLLELARADSGHLHYQIEPCIVNDIVTEVAAMAQQQSQREIQITSQVNPLEVKADYNRLKQILLNLIDNAIKYSEENTLITIEIKQQKEEVIIQICDQGYGIPLKHQSRIFERFYRIDEARHRTGGTGLGLSIVKTLIEGMGGSVSVRSKLGEGSIFTLCLPA
ncbi:MAG: ATP-binding protein [Cyanobacteria bacterium P01_A01_bin.45]